MKFTYLLLICALTMNAVFAYPQYKQDNNKKLPQIVANGGGSPKQGYDVNVDVRQNIWESQNKRHSFDATAGYSQHLGGPYGNSPADRRVGGVYTFRF